MHWWVTDYLNAPHLGVVYLVSVVFWVIFSICLHELAHGWAAIRCGDRTPIELGHMTLNPLVHMGPMSLIMFAVVGISWGMMPVNPSRFRGRFDDALVALAGPAMNVLLALVSGVAYIVWIGAAGGYWFGHGVENPLYKNVQMFFFVGVMKNVILAAFNLLPVPPLDGGTIARTLIPPYGRLFSTEGGTRLAGIIFIVVFLNAGGIINSTVGSAARSGLDRCVKAAIPGVSRPPATGR